MLENERNTGTDGLDSMYQVCLDRLRRQMPFRLVTGSPLLENPVKPGAGENDENKELIRQIRDAMDSLPHKQKVILELRDFQEIGYEEISQTMGMTVKAVRGSVARSRKLVTARIKMVKNT